MAIPITMSSWVVVSLFSLSKSATSTLLVVSEISLLFFGLLLVVGSLGEIAKTAKWKVYTTLSGWRAYSKIAIILLIVGVAGELIADGFIFAFSSHLQNNRRRRICGTETRKLHTLEKWLAKPCNAEKN